MKKNVDLITPDGLEKTIKIIGSKIRMNRKNTYKNYEKFAHEHGFNKVTILRLERGENCTITTLIQVLHALNLPIEDFFKGIK